MPKRGWALVSAMMSGEVSWSWNSCTSSKVSGEVRSCATRARGSRLPLTPCQYLSQNLSRLALGSPADIQETPPARALSSAAKPHSSAPDTNSEV